MSCFNCLTSAKGQQEELAKTRTLAKAFAIEKGQPTVIYREGLEFEFCLESVARLEQYAIIEFVSQYP